MEPLLPPRPKHPLGCHNPRVPDRSAMDAIFFVLRTGCQWNALSETGICSSSSAHRRFQEWVKAGVFAAFWREGLLSYEALRGIDWTWLALDGALEGVAGQDYSAAVYGVFSKIGENLVGQVMIEAIKDTKKDLTFVP